MSRRTDFIRNDRQAHAALLEAAATRGVQKAQQRREEPDAPPAWLVLAGFGSVVVTMLAIAVGSAVLGG